LLGSPEAYPEVGDVSDLRFSDAAAEDGTERWPRDRGMGDDFPAHPFEKLWRRALGNTQASFIRKILLIPVTLKASMIAAADRAQGGRSSFTAAGRAEQNKITLAGGTLSCNDGRTREILVGPGRDIPFQGAIDQLQHQRVFAGEVETGR